MQRGGVAGGREEPGAPGGDGFSGGGENPGRGADPSGEADSAGGGAGRGKRKRGDDVAGAEPTFWRAADDGTVARAGGGAGIGHQLFFAERPGAGDGSRGKDRGAGGVRGDAGDGVFADSSGVRDFDGVGIPEFGAVSGGVEWAAGEGAEIGVAAANGESGGGGAGVL